MKSKRRHELQTNELADRLGHWIDRVRPHLTTIALASLAVVAIVFVYFYWSSSKDRLASESWREYIYASYAGANVNADVVKELDRVADSFSDTEAGLWAAVNSADFEAGQGVSLLFSQKESAVDHLLNAIEGYRGVLENELVMKRPMLKSRAHLGLAQTNEAYWAYNDQYKVIGDKARKATSKLNCPNTDCGEGVEPKIQFEPKEFECGSCGTSYSAAKIDCAKAAEKNYKAIVEADKDSVLATVAQRRLDRMARASTQEFYAWIQTQEPLVGSSLPPGDDIGLPGENLNTVPDGPNFKLFGDDIAGDEGAGDEAAKTMDSDAEETAAEDVTDVPPAKKETGEEDGEETPSVDGPAIDGPTVDPPTVNPPAGEPAKEAASAGKEKKETP